MKVVVRKLDQHSQPGKRNPSTVTQPRVRGPSGEMKTIQIVDARSDTFGTDFLWVFRQNVAKARTENKRLTGFADGRADKL